MGNKKIIKMEKINIELENLTKPELLKLKEDIESQLKYIDDLNGLGPEIKPSLAKNKLSDLKPNDLIFCINFDGRKIYQMDYVKITFNKKNDKDWTNFRAEHDTKPMGCSSSMDTESMNNHYFLSEFSSSMYFFTLKPQTWKTDLKSEAQRLVKIKKEYNNKNIKIFKTKISDLIKAANKLDAY